MSNLELKKAILNLDCITDRFNGYGMPIVKVVSDNNIKIINRGWNEFESVNEVDSSALEVLRDRIDVNKHDTVMLEIRTPERITNCWYSLKGDVKYSLMW